MVNAYFNPPANEVRTVVNVMIKVSDLFVQIVFPAGIMRPPFFSQSWCVVVYRGCRLNFHLFPRPAYMSYGAFGMVASHELTVGPVSSRYPLVSNCSTSQHAFDSSGRLYNENGKLEEWWTEETSEGFNDRQKCIVNQYSKYTIDDGKGGKAHVNVSPNSSPLPPDD